MELLRKKIESLINKTDEAEDSIENCSSMKKDLKELISDNETLSEDLKRRIIFTRTQLASTRSKTEEVLSKIKFYEEKVNENERINSKLAGEADQKEEQCNEIEIKSAKAKLDHMELSGAYEDARSRKQLLTNEIEKVKSLREHHEEHAQSLEKRIQKANNRLDDLSQQSQQNQSFEEHVENATAHIGTHIQSNRSKEDNAKLGIDALNIDIQSKQNEIKETIQQREQLETEIEQLLNEIETV